MDSSMVQILFVAIAIAVFALLLQRSHAFRYYVKFIYFYVVLLCTGLYVIISCVLRLRIRQDIRNIRMVANIWITMFSIYKLKVEIRGKEQMQSNRPFVIVCNHQSGLDVITMMSVIPDNCTVLIKKELLYFSGPFGIGAWLCGLIFVDRMNRGRAHETMGRTVQMMHERKLNLWIFPEGTRSHGNTMLPFKKGAFHLAVQGQVPVMPIVISSYDNFLNLKKSIFNPGRIIVSCLPAVPTVGLGADDVNALTERVRQQMLDVYKLTSDELKSPAAGR